jgi:hypothetical protein
MLSRLFIHASNVLLDKTMIMLGHDLMIPNGQHEDGNFLSRSKSPWEISINKITILVYNYRSNVTV